MTQYPFISNIDTHARNYFPPFILKMYLSCCKMIKSTDCTNKRIVVPAQTTPCMCDISCILFESYSLSFRVIYIYISLL